MMMRAVMKSAAQDLAIVLMQIVLQFGYSPAVITTKLSPLMIFSHHSKVIYYNLPPRGCLDPQ
jgi:hypothetical protein